MQDARCKMQESRSKKQTKEEMTNKTTSHTLCSSAQCATESVLVSGGSDLRKCLTSARLHQRLGATAIAFSPFQSCLWHSIERAPHSRLRKACLFRAHQLAKESPENKRHIFNPYY
eukprot:5804182-Amphidinium_carterae.1